MMIEIQGFGETAERDTVWVNDGEKLVLMEEVPEDAEND